MISYKIKIMLFTFFLVTGMKLNAADSESQHLESHTINRVIYRTPTEVVAHNVEDMNISHSDAPQTEDFWVRLENALDCNLSCGTAFAYGMIGLQLVIILF